MKRIALVASLVFAAVVPASALAAAPTHAHVVTYERAYHQVVHQFGKMEPGRNIVMHGLSNGKPASDADVVKSILVLRRMLAPPAAVVAYAPRTTPAATTTTSTYRASTTYSAPAASYSGSGGYVIPSSIVQCESGGNWHAVNSSSGAGGAYQIIPSTWRAYGGTGLPQNASPAEQNRVAAQVWAHQGRGAWTC